MSDHTESFLVDISNQCGFGWYTYGNVYHNCKLKKRHRGNHKCVVKYRGSEHEKPCKCYKRRVKP